MLESSPKNFNNKPINFSDSFVFTGELDGMGHIISNAVMNKSNIFAENNGIINCIVIKNNASKYSRKELDKLTDYVKTYKASGLAWLKIDNEISGSIVKVLKEEEINNIKEKLSLENNDLVLFVADKYSVVKTSLGALRRKIANDLNLIKLVLFGKVIFNVLSFLRYIVTISFLIFNFSKATYGSGIFCPQSSSI